MADIQIVVGSVMGTANSVAKTAQTILEGHGHNVTFHEIFNRSTFDPKAYILVCTSSTGMGDLPETIVPFYSFIVRECPQIASLPYGIISLGDSSYPNFAEAGRVMDEALSDLGANRVGEIFVMDATEVADHEEEAVDWINQWHEALAKL